MANSSHAPRQPADADIRRRVVHELDTSFFLEAGAGAGKTRVMVERVIETVRQGKAELREIVAITFTEKAAGELRARIRRGLADELKDAPNPQERERLRTAQEQVDVAQIGTIHAFASSLLRERPFEAKLDPYFSVLDQLGQTLDFRDAWDDWIWSGRDQSHTSALEEMLSHGLQVSHIQDAAELVGRYRDLNPPSFGAEVPDPAATLDQWIAAAQQTANAYRRVEDSPEAHNRIAALLQGLDDLRGSERDGEDADALARRMALFAADPAIRPPRKYKRNAEARELWDDAADDRNEFADAVRSTALHRLLRALTDFVTWHADRRRAAGKLSFDDLLLYARNLIRDHPRARQHFRRRFKTLLIDEFQDTDPLQSELVLLLAAAEDTDDWRAAQPAPGKLFVVGDPKQSIYRFRRADIRIYQQVQRIFEQTAEGDAGAAVERLGVNFRSRPDLVGWANDAFPQVLHTDPEHRGAQADYGKPIAAHREGDGPGVVVIDGGDVFERVTLAREAEADLLVRLIHDLTENRAGFGQLPCENCDACQGKQACPAPRPPRMGDIAVLVRTRTAIDTYTKAFDQHAIPYHLDSGRGFFTRPEIHDFANILMAVDDPTDEVAVMSALKTPLASASDQELFDYVYARNDPNRRARFTLDEHAVPDEYDGPLRDGFEQLRNLRDGLRDRSLPQFIDFVLHKSGLLEAQFAHGIHGAERAANLQMLVHRAAEFAAAAEDSLRPFVQWIAQRRDQDLSEAESATSEAVEQVVRILTIHQAKGLEFPIVIVPKLGDGRRDTTQLMVDRENDTFEIQVGPSNAGFHTPGFDPDRERTHAEAEFRRLLYVAATRAEDWLILPHFLAQSRAESTFAAFLEEPLQTADPDHVIELSPDQFDAFEPPTPEPAPVAHQAITDAWQSRRAATLETGRVNIITRAPSQHGGDAEKAEREAGTADDGDDDTTPPEYVPPASSRAQALKRGIAIHRALALADLNDPARTANIARRVAEEYDLDPTDFAAEIHRVLNTDLLRRAAQADQRHFELPLVQAANSANGADAAQITITEGVADLVFHEPDGWIVVDFKSDRSRDRERDRRYKEQVRTYATMLTAAGQTVKEAWLLYTHTGAAEQASLAQPQSETAQ